MHSDLPLNRRALLGTLAALTLPACAQRAPLTAAALGAVVDKAYRPLLRDHAIPAMVIGVLDGGRSHLFPYGTATVDTLFELGSVSKCFTATLAGLAQAEGRLSLADTPGRYVPALRGSALDRASLLQFGTYTAAGLPLQFPDGIDTYAAALGWLRNVQPTIAPGTVRRYSNPSIGLMGHAVAAAMGRDFASACEAQLFPALGLQNTFVRVPAHALPAYAWGTDREGRPVRVNPGAFDAEGYGVKSTTRDMLRFVQAQLQPDALPAPLRAAVMETQAPRFEVGPMVQGLGWEQYPWPTSRARLLDGNSSAMALEAQPAQALTRAPWDDGAILFNKTGSTNGFGAYVAFVPSQRVGVVMLANRNFPNAARVTAALEVLSALTGTEMLA